MIGNDEHDGKEGGRVMRFLSRLWRWRRAPKGPRVDITILGADASVTMTWGRGCD